MAKSRLHELSEQGVSVWIDSLSREMLETGELARLMSEDAVVGVTSNPTIFQKALARATGTTSSSARCSKTEDDPTEIFLPLAMEDIRAACDLMQPVWDDGRRRRLRLARGRPDARLRPRGDLRAGDPAARGGRPAEPVRQDPGDRARARRDRGLHREGQVDQRDADLLARALRGRRRGVHPGARAARRGRRRPGEGRVGRELLRLARRHGGGPAARGDRRPGDALKGKLAIANAKLAYRHWQETFSGERWEFLAGKGARPQRCLWASTSTKNPDYRDVMYVEELIGPETVNTMPAETVAPSRTTAKVAPTRSPRAGRGAQAARASWPRPASTTTTSSRRSRRRACRSSPTRSSELLDGIRAQAAASSPPA